MVDVVNKRCLQEDCNTLPVYGTQWKKPLYCKDHKQPGMVDVVNKRCLQEDCNTRPVYGTQWKKPLYCKDHKQPGMVNVVSKRCLQEDCNTQPAYGTQWKKPLYCKDHKQPGMVNVVNKRCLQEDCNTRPVYGTHLTGKIKCAKHCDKSKQWKVKSCIYSKCKLISIYSKSGQYPYEYCDNHFPNGYKSNLTTTCIKCGLTEMVCDKDSKCLLSCSEIHKDRLKYSENEMLKFFTNKKLQFINDKRVMDGCSSRRPDFIFHTSYGILIVENDENQHKSRACDCEQTRMIQIHQDFGENVHFIRFNPDRYRTTKTLVDLSSRHIKLYEIVESILNHSEYFFTNNMGLSVRYMFYDDCDGKFSVTNIDY
jgi:hypothetical protein